MLYGTKYALFVMPCNAGKLKCLVNSQTKQTLNMSPVPFELKDHLSTIIAYSSLSSLALLIKNSSVSHAKKSFLLVSLTSLWERHLSLIPVERVRLWTCGMFPLLSVDASGSVFHVKWLYNCSGFEWALCESRVCCVCVLQMSSSAASPMAASSSTAAGRGSGKATSFIPELQSMM